MAELVGIDFTYISKIENGTMDLPAEDKIIQQDSNPFTGLDSFYCEIPGKKPPVEIQADMIAGCLRLAGLDTGNMDEEEFGNDSERSWETLGATFETGGGTALRHTIARVGGQPAGSGMAGVDDAPACGVVVRGLVLMHQVVQEAKGKGRATLLRGSAGSSHVACLLGLTDCNPLPLHYCCPQCIWFPELHAASGYDLPEMACPKCGSPMKGDGHHIPLEAFVGPDGTLPRNLYLAVSREFWETANRLLQQGSVPEPAVMKPDSP